MQKRFGGNRWQGRYSGYSSKDMVLLAEAVWQQGFAPWIAAKTVEGVWDALRVRTQSRIEVCYIYKVYKFSAFLFRGFSISGYDEGWI